MIAVVQQQQQKSMMSPKTVVENESGESTPVIANVHDTTATAGAKSPAELTEPKKKSSKEDVVKKSLESSQMNVPKKETPRKDAIAKNAKAADRKAYSPNPLNMSRLMSDLQRTEQEKKEALEQVNKLKSLLEQGKQLGEKSSKKTKSTISNNSHWLRIQIQMLDYWISSRV